MNFSWSDTEEIALKLFETYPSENPLTIRFPDLRDRVKKLAGFQDDPEHPVNEKKLEAIQMAWLEEFELGLESRPS